MPELDLPSVIGGRYRPVRLLGKGGMGTVYEVEHLRTGQRLALKVLTLQAASSVERFQREARAACLIPSEHVVRVTDADVAPELGGAPYIVMELLAGADLEHVSGNAPVAPAEVVEWLRQVARALGKAHERGIVHRDLKPDNLFLTHREDGAPLVKVLDFGIAKMMAEGTALTRSDQFLGTPLYMAPEQAASSGPPVTPQADLYALGLTAFRLLTGRTYWNTGKLSQVLAQILAAPMPPPSTRGAQFGAQFDAWFLRACDRDPAKRFSTAHEQVEALAAVFGLPAQLRISDPVPKPVGGSAVKTLASPTPPGSSSAPGSSSDGGVSQSLLGRRPALTGGLAIGGVILLVIATATLRSATRKRPVPAGADAMQPGEVTSAVVPPSGASSHWRHDEAPASAAGSERGPGPGDPALATSTPDASPGEGGPRSDAAKPLDLRPGQH